MCNPNINNRRSSNRERKRVVISGAGPAGLLLCSLLLNKNKQQDCSVTYDVTLLDGRQDYGSFTKQELSENHRSWMLGLNDHGLDAIRALPALYENYVKGEGVLLEEINLYLGAKKLTMNMDSMETVTKFRVSQGEDPTAGRDNFIVDRNFIVAALARYIKDTHENDPHYTAKYETTCQYVDYENRRVLVRDVNTKNEEYLSYDLLIGCDGVRSVVREALVKRHSDFYLEYTDIFSDFKPFHVKRPRSVSEKGMSLLPDVFPGCEGICLPETGDLVNIGIGAKRNNFENIADELKSDDYKVVAEYFKKNFKAFELEDYDDCGKQWVNQRWNQTGMVHCNFYHSLKAGVVIMGDAAHATSPSIGMGMNTALRDAQVFSEILEETNDKFEEALPEFSKARVCEGNSLSDLAFHLYCNDTRHQLIETVHMVVRGFLYSKFPRFVAEHPQSMVGRRGVSLSQCYERAVNLGIINKHRVINDRIRLENFEQKVGMIQTPHQGRSTTSRLMIGAAIAVIASYVYQNVL